ncbi:MAG: DNA internalization-related competence protein ComEC/Rec2 [Clostridia bacterium]|nr:DNA internalization-related competence protein ComEC/Rec2 [Clostridia bacterium]MDD4375509.1 DNA internalization-related competence protein ComEC/Rec2 [Clostridia bacterium]
MHRYENKYINDIKQTKYFLKIIERRKLDEEKTTYIVKNNNDKFLLNIYFKDNYDKKKNMSEDEIYKHSSYKYGDILDIQGKIKIWESMSNIGEFNYMRYLASNNIYGTIIASDIKYVGSDGNYIINTIYKLRDKVYKILSENITKKYLGVIEGIMYGKIYELDKDVKKTFNNIGVSHILSVSGSHLNIIIYFLTLLLSKRVKNKKIKVSIQILIVILFTLFATFSLSILRASVMLIIKLLFGIKNKKVSMLNLLIYTYLLFLLINPMYVYNIGMTLSFLAVFGIHGFSNKIEQYIKSKIYWNIKSDKTANAVFKGLKAIAITLSANIVILPISLYSFQTFSLIFILSNLIIGLISNLIMILSFVAVIINFIPYLSKLLFHSLEMLTFILIETSEFLSSINYIISVKAPSILIIILYYMLIAILYIGIKKRNKNKLFRNRLKDYIQYVTFILGLLTSLLIIKNNFFSDHIYYFNVGQGEMSMISKGSKNILIDIGSISHDASYILNNYMKRENKKQIDLVIITHFHKDHMNGIYDIIESYKVKRIAYVLPNGLEIEEYNNFYKYIKDKKVGIMLINKGDVINLGKVKMQVISPNMKEIFEKGNNETDNLNENSLVLNIRINNKNFLFTGDVTKHNEKNINKSLKKADIKNIEILSVAHHGSKTSTSKEFLEGLTIKNAIISSKKSVYNHPSKEVISKLKYYNIKYYLTEERGGILYKLKN